MSPLRVLRASFDEDTTAPDPLRGLVLAVVLLFIVAFAYAVLLWASGSLWAPIAAHGLNNLALSLLAV